MRLSRSQYDPEYFHELASKELEVVSDSEAKAWIQHPCTKYMMYALRGDMAGIVLCWMEGAYAKENIEAAAQENAKLMGQIQTIDEILETMETIGENRETGEENGDQGIGTYSPS